MNLKNKVIFLLIFLFTLPCIAQDSKHLEDYFIDFTVHQMATQNRISLLQNKSNIKKLGTEVLKGKISGTLTYETVIDMKKLSGVVYLTWENFSDEEGWIFDGQIITHANMKGNGYLEGQIKTSGFYDGTVFFDKITLKESVAGDGTYGIVLENCPRTEIPYSLYFKAMGEDYTNMGE